MIVWDGATLASAPAERAVQREATAGSRFVHTVERGQNLTSIGAHFGMDVRGLARVNGLSPDARLHVGQQLTVDARHVLPASSETEIVINIPQRMLFVLTDHLHRSLHRRARGTGSDLGCDTAHQLDHG